MSRQKNERIVIYSLADEASPDRVRYVGQTANPMQRLKGHAVSQRTSAQVPPVHRWIAEEMPRLVMGCLEFCSAREADERELHWMVEFRRQGMADLNVMSAGICTAYGIPHFKNHANHRRARRRCRRVA